MSNRKVTALVIWALILTLGIAFLVFSQAIQLDKLSELRDTQLKNGRNSETQTNLMKNQTSAADNQTALITDMKNTLDEFSNNSGNEAYSGRYYKQKWEEVLKYNDDSFIRKAAKPVGEIQLKFETSKASETCTGFIVSADLVATAAHCIVPKSTESGKLVSIKFIVGKLYYSSVSTEDKTTQSFELNPTPVEVLLYDDYDYALFRLASTSDAEGFARWGSVEIAPLDFQKKTTGELPLFAIHYPRSLNQMVTRFGCHTTNEAQLELLGDLEGLILHDCDTDEGSSGAPLFNSDGKVVGIHKGRSFLKNQIKPDDLTKRDLIRRLGLNEFTSAREITKKSKILPPILRKYDALDQELSTTFDALSSVDWENNSKNSLVKLQIKKFDNNPLARLIVSVNPLGRLQCNSVLTDERTLIFTNPICISNSDIIPVDQRILYFTPDGKVNVPINVPKSWPIHDYEKQFSSEPELTVLQMKISENSDKKIPIPEKKLQIRDTPLKKGDSLWMAYYNQNFTPLTILCTVDLVNDDIIFETNIKLQGFRYICNDGNGELLGSQGAMILDEEGKLVGINYGTTQTSNIPESPDFYHNGFRIMPQTLSEIPTP